VRSFHAGIAFAVIAPCIGDCPALGIALKGPRPGFNPGDQTYNARTPSSMSLTGDPPPSAFRDLMPFWFRAKNAQDTHGPVFSDSFTRQGSATLCVILMVCQMRHASKPAAPKKRTAERVIPKFVQGSRQHQPSPTGDSTDSQKNADHKNSANETDATRSCP